MTEIGVVIAFLVCFEGLRLLEDSVSMLLSSQGCGVKHLSIGRNDVYMRLALLTDGMPRAGLDCMRGSFSFSMPLLLRR